MIDAPSQTSSQSPKNTATILERADVKMIINQRTFLRVYTIDSIILADGGLGLIFSPKLNVYIYVRYRQDKIKLIV